MQGTLQQPVTQRAIKHQVVAAQLRDELCSGSWLPGDRLPSFAQLRERFTATPATVSMALATLESEGLVVREQGRGVFVAEVQTERQHAIGVFGFDVKLTTTPYWVHLMEGIQQVAHREEMEVTLLHPTSRRGLEKVDGVLLHGDEAGAALNRLPPGMPAVDIMGVASGVASVAADDFGGTKQATEYLLAQGHRRIGCLMYVQTDIIQRRLSGYRAALGEAGVTELLGWVHPLCHKGYVPLRELGRLNMQDWIQQDWAELGCTAVLAQNDAVAMGAMQALSEAGQRVPEDVSVVGFDSTEECELSTPRLTSVQVPLQKIGATAAQLLLRQIHEEEVEPVTTVLPARLEVRDSTAPVAE